VLRSNQPADFAAAVPSTIFDFHHHHHHYFNCNRQCKEKKRLAVVLYLFRNLQNLNIVKKVNFPYLRVISSLFSPDTAVRKFVPCLWIWGPTRSTNKEKLSMLEQLWIVIKFIRNSISTQVQIVVKEWMHPMFPFCLSSLTPSHPPPYHYRINIMFWHCEREVHEVGGQTHALEMMWATNWTLVSSMCAC
jgi:hypothetical protein